MNAPPPQAPSASPLVTFKGVNKSFPNGGVALQGLDLDVRPGEFLSLIGPSGCGKSTALRIMAGLAEPSGGTVRWIGTKPEIGFVFQEPTLMPWANVFDNVWLPLRLRKRSRTEAEPAIMRALELVGLATQAGHLPSELSGGMKMRVSIARALATRPGLLLMDEPFAALDEITRFRLNNDLLRLKAELGMTVVFVTHSVFESVYLSDRIVVMAANPGRAVADIAVPEPQPRQDAFRTRPAYLELCQETSAALQAAMSHDQAA